jgi:hypothetical protein
MDLVDLFRQSLIRWLNSARFSYLLENDPEFINYTANQHRDISCVMRMLHRREERQRIKHPYIKIPECGKQCRCDQHKRIFKLWRQENPEQANAWKEAELDCMIEGATVFHDQASFACPTCNKRFHP